MSKFLPLLALALAVPVHAADAADPIEAIKAGKATLEVRTRYEHVDDQGNNLTARKLTADAITNRIALGFKTGSWKGVSATLQFENVANLAEPRYNYKWGQANMGRTDHAVIADPNLTQVNQFYIEWEGLKVGRQTVALDNHRFIGSVAWRQNDQTFTGATYSRTTKYVDFMLGHLTKQHNIVGQTLPIAANLANVNVKVIPGGNIRAFWYGFNLGDQATGTGATYKDASFSNLGFRVDGLAWKVLYDVSIAKQKAYKDGNTALDADYSYVGLGFKFDANHSVMAAQEKLESGFQTPYATLHAWNGWADRFLLTPGNGLVDTFVTYKGKFGAFGVDANYHTYKADLVNAKYGTELGLAVDYKVNSWLTVMAKAANYTADSETAKFGANFNKDLKKFWLQTVMKF